MRPTKQVWKWILLAAVLAGPAASHAQNRCPWLNVATASGFLEGQTTLEMRKVSDDQTDCLFRYRKQKAARTLRISVFELKDTSQGLTPYVGKCTSRAEPVKAIGNEAVSCSADEGASHGEQIIGRVRDRIFFVVVTDGRGGDPPMLRDAMKGKVEAISEQVAGSLF